MQWKVFTQKNLGKKHTDQEIKNEEVIEGIHDGHFQNFRLVRLIWYRAVQVSTRQLEEELIMLNQHLLTKVNLYNPNQAMCQKVIFLISRGVNGFQNKLQNKNQNS